MYTIVQKSTATPVHVVKVKAVPPLYPPTKELIVYRRRSTVVTDIQLTI